MAAWIRLRGNNLSDWQLVYVLRKADFDHLGVLIVPHQRLRLFNGPQVLHELYVLQDLGQKSQNLPEFTPCDPYRPENDQRRYEV